MEDCSKTTTGAVPVLPDGPLVDILSRVPAKSVCRFKCVSKAWRDFIADPDNRKKLRQPMRGLLVQTPEVDDNALSSRIDFSFVDLSVGSVPLDIDPCFSSLTEMAGINTFFVSDSCNGLILLGHLKDQGLSYTVCNPTTKQWSAVPACGSHAEVRNTYLRNTYLAFDPAVSSHFHLVEFQTPQMPIVDKDIVSLHVYSSETGTWSQNQINKQEVQLEGQHPHFTLETIEHQHCAFVNGFLHLIVWGSDVQQHILAVDVQGKARRMITVPLMTDQLYGHNFVCYLGQSQGHIHCMTVELVGEREKLSTWVLQDYDTQEWVLKNTVNYLDVFGETGEIMPRFHVIDIHQDCNVVFFFHKWSRELIAYNMDRGEVSVIATFEDRKFQSKFAHYIPYFSESPALTNKY